MVTLGTDDTDTMQRVNMSVCLCVVMNKLLYACIILGY